MKYKLILLLFVFIFKSWNAFSDDSTYLKVHFVYGSKPKKKYLETENKWFGGIHGGHVGIEFESNKIIDFVPSGTFHYFSKNKNRNSKFAIHSNEMFWNMFDIGEIIVKKATFVIPISKAQKQKLDSIVKVYTSETPYDYALFGMRCGAAAYEILGQLGIVKAYSKRKTSRIIFYPKKLRKRLFKIAETKNWKVIKAEGTSHRKWERD